MPIPLIIDTDPGIDDAIAIMLAAASPEVDLRGIVAVAGNVSLDHTARNAAALADLLGLAVPVGAGAAGPLCGQTPVTAAEVHGANGFAGYTLAESGRLVEPGVPLLARLIDESPEPPTVVAIGPLTNIALLLVQYPESAGRIGRLVSMGGGWGRHLGNVTPCAEFNVFADPEAAAKVFASGLPITLVGLNVTEETTLGAGHLPQLWASGGPVAQMTRHLLERYRGELTTEGAAQHDSAAVAQVVAPDLITTVPARVTVETRGVATRGMTVVDEALRTGEANCRFAVASDVAGFRALMHERLTRLDRSLAAR